MYIKIITFSILFLDRGNNTEYIPHNIAHDCLPVDLWFLENMEYAFIRAKIKYIIQQKTFIFQAL